MRPLIAALLLTTALAGCADVSPADEVARAFDDVERLPQDVTDAVGLPAGLAVINSTAILASTDGSTWSTTLRVVPEALQHDGDQPPVQPTGGGSRIDLTAPELGSLHLRLATNHTLDGITVVWLASRGDLADAVLLGNTSATEVLEVPFPWGKNRVFATLMKGDDPVAVTGKPLVIHSIVTWEVRDSVHPVNPNGAVPLDEAQRTARADRYHLPPGIAGTLHVETAFDGTWTPNQGTDIDLEFLDGTRSLQCIGTGGGGGTLPVDPSQSTEVGTQAANAGGEYIVRLGYVSTACGNHYFHNAGPVPYRATITLES